MKLRFSSDTGAVTCFYYAETTVLPDILTWERIQY